MLPYMLPTKHPGNKQGKCSASQSLCYTNTHARAHIKLCYWHCLAVNLLHSNVSQQYLSCVHTNKTHVALCADPKMCVVIQNVCLDRDKSTGLAA